jgi:hypothetical protein
VLWCLVKHRDNFNNFILSQKKVKPLLLCVTNLNNHFSQAARTEEVYLHQTRLSRDRHNLCLPSCCCAQVVSPEMLLVTNGFLTNSDFEI